MQAAQVPEDSLRMGLVRTFAAEESAILGYHKDPLYNAGLFMNGEAIRRDCVEKMRRFDVRPHEPTLTTANFSGGHQQKIVLALELSLAPPLLLVGHPPRGVAIVPLQFLHLHFLSLLHPRLPVLL